MKRSRMVEPEAMPKATEPGPEMEGIIRRERRPARRQYSLDLLVTPRCPVCRYPLVARMTCFGPRFPCACE